MPREHSRSARIEARIAPDALAVVKLAAEMQGRSISDFVVAAAQEAARRRSKTPPSSGFRSRNSSVSLIFCLIRRRYRPPCSGPKKPIPG